LTARLQPPSNTPAAGMVRLTCHEAAMKPDEQLELFRNAVQLLGGTVNAARLLDISPRHLIRLTQGTADLHAGFLRDTAAALLTRADQCRALERQLTPAFARNLPQGN